MIDDETLKDLVNRIIITALNEVATIEDITHLHETGFNVTIEDGQITTYSY